MFAQLLLLQQKIEAGCCLKFPFAHLSELIKQSSKEFRKCISILAQASALLKPAVQSKEIGPEAESVHTSIGKCMQTIFSTTAQKGDVKHTCKTTNTSSTTPNIKSKPILSIFASP